MQSGSEPEGRSARLSKLQMCTECRIAASPTKGINVLPAGFGFDKISIKNLVYQGTEVGGTEVGGTEVGGTEVGGTEVGGTEVGGTSVAVGGTLVAVGGTSVAVGGTLVAVGGTLVAVGGTSVGVQVGRGVDVGGIGVKVREGVAVDVGSGVAVREAVAVDVAVAVGRGVAVREGVAVGVHVKVAFTPNKLLVSVGRIGVFEGLTFGFPGIVLVMVGVILGVDVAKKWANGLNIPSPPDPPGSVAPVFGIKKFESIISRSRVNPPVRSNGTLNPRIQVNRIPAEMMYMFRFRAFTFITLLFCIAKVVQCDGCDVIICLRCLHPSRSTFYIMP